MTPRRRSTRERILTVLRADGRAMTTAELARRVRVHPNTVRFHIEVLVERGQVEQIVDEPQGPGRPAVRVQAVAGMDPQGPRHYRLLAEALTAALADGPDPAGDAERAGRAWGGRLAAEQNRPRDDAAAVDTLFTILDGLGFEPERHDQTDIGLRSCPFLELAASSREVVCSVHLGLMRGALAELRAGTQVDRLTPFARPDLCVAHLRKAHAA